MLSAGFLGGRDGDIFDLGSKRNRWLSLTLLRHGEQGSAENNNKGERHDRAENRETTGGTGRETGWRAIIIHCGYSALALKPQELRKLSIAKSTEHIYTTDIYLCYKVQVILWSVYHYPLNDFSFYQLLHKPHIWQHLLRPCQLYWMYKIKYLLQLVELTIVTRST